jgi:hypothetical protein
MSGASLGATEADACTEERARPWARRSPRALRFGTLAGAAAAARRAKLVVL